MSTPFTPGPWNTHSYYNPIDGPLINCENFDAKCIAIASGEKLIGEVSAFLWKVPDRGYARVESLEESEANARLIAAAPEMYMQLIGIRDKMCCVCKLNQIVFPASPGIECTVCAIDKLLAKAVQS